ncbi:TPA: hypothetical protein ACH3X2_001887 [Trebouxia sp. C0005]
MDTQCPYCTNNSLCQHNSLLTKAPTAAAYWDTVKNGLTPDLVMAGSAARRHWLCPKCGHSWQAHIHRRVEQQSGCPKCSKINKPWNRRPSLTQSQHPAMLEFDIERNRRAGFDPGKITAGSNKMVHWICNHCPKGRPHLFVATVQSRIALNSGCPYCASKKACICNSLQSLYPALAAEYDTARNGGGPEQVLPRSRKAVFWKDASGHTWEQSPFQRTSPERDRSKRAAVKARLKHGNCFFGLQSLSLGLGEQWEKVKTAYAQANRALGDIVKVTPSSKVVGDLAQFMVQNDLDDTKLVEKAGSLNLPGSVEDLLQGNLGQPAGGFPEPLTSRVIKDKKNIAGRPGAGLSPVNLRQQEMDLKDKHDKSSITYRDVMSSAMYPQVFDEFKNWQGKYSKYTEAIPTRAFLTPLDEDEEVEVDISKGNITHIKYRAMGELQPNGTREVFFDTNGVPRTVEIVDTTDQGEGGSPIRKAAREKALPDVLGSVGAPMAGEVMQGCQVTQDISNIHGLWTVQCT